MTVAQFFFLVFLSIQNCIHVSAVLNTTRNSTTVIFDPDTPLDKLPAGTVLLMFSKKYCTGQGAAIIHNFCHHLGFDEWQGESLYFKCSCRRCASAQCTTSDCEPCGEYVSGVTFKPAEFWLPQLHCGIFLKPDCALSSEWPGPACLTTRLAANRCFNLNAVCLDAFQNDPVICDSPDIKFQNGGRDPCFKSFRTADFACPGW